MKVEPTRKDLSVHLFQKLVNSRSNAQTEEVVGTSRILINQLGKTNKPVHCVFKGRLILPFRVCDFSIRESWHFANQVDLQKASYISRSMETKLAERSLLTTSILKPSIPISSQKRIMS